MKKLLFFLVLFPASAFATTHPTYYANTDCSLNGDASASTCAASGGGAGAAKTLNAALTIIKAATPNFVTADVDVTVDVRGGTVDATVPVFTGITTGGSNQLRVLATVANRWRGYRDSARYTLANADSVAVLRPRTQFVTVTGLQIISTSNVNGDANAGVTIESESWGGQILLDSNYIGKEGTTTNAANHGVYAWYVITGGLGGQLLAQNNAIVGFAGDGVKAGIDGPNTAVIFCQNTIKNSGLIGFEPFLFWNPSIMQFRNNIFIGSGSSDYLMHFGSGLLFTSTNLTADATSPDGASYQGATPTFGPLPLDMRLSGTDTVAFDRGTDVHADARCPSALDSIGTVRPQFSAFDIGMNERFGSGPVLPSTVKSLLGMGVGN